MSISLLQTPSQLARRYNSQIRGGWCPIPSDQKTFLQKTSSLFRARYPFSYPSCLDTDETQGVCDLSLFLREGLRRDTPDQRRVRAEVSPSMPCIKPSHLRNLSLGLVRFEVLEARTPPIFSRTMESHAPRWCVFVPELSPHWLVTR